MLLFLGAHLPEVELTFGAPASHASFQAMLHVLKIEQYAHNLRGLEMFYKIHNGQDILFDKQISSPGQQQTDYAGVFKGIIGGYR